MTKNAGGRPKTNLACKDILDIIKCCREQKVVELSYGGLVVRFHARANEKPVTPLEDCHQPISLKEIEEEFSNTEMGIKMDELANLAIADPVQHEELLARGDLMEMEDATDIES